MDAAFVAAALWSLHSSWKKSADRVDDYCRDFETHLAKHIAVVFLRGHSERLEHMAEGSREDDRTIDWSLDVRGNARVNTFEACAGYRVVVVVTKHSMRLVDIQRIRDKAYHTWHRDLLECHVVQRVQ